MTVEELQHNTNYVFYNWPFKCTVQVQRILSDWTIFKIIEPVKCYDKNDMRNLSDIFELDNTDIHKHIFEVDDILKTLPP